MTKAVLLRKMNPRERPGILGESSLAKETPGLAVRLKE
jgi:hypothetical protein